MLFFILSFCVQYANTISFASFNNMNSDEIFSAIRKTKIKVFNINSNFIHEQNYLGNIYPTKKPEHTIISNDNNKWNFFYINNNSLYKCDWDSDIELNDIINNFRELIKFSDYHNFNLNGDSLKFIERDVWEMIQTENL